MAKVAQGQDSVNSGHTSTSLLSRVKSIGKRAASPALTLLRSASNSGSNASLSENPALDQPSQAYTIAPTSHREVRFVQRAIKSIAEPRRWLCSLNSLLFIGSLRCADEILSRLIEHGSTCAAGHTANLAHLLSAVPFTAFFR